MLPTRCDSILVRPATALLLLLALATNCQAEAAAPEGAGPAQPQPSVDDEGELLMDMWVGFYIGDAKVRYAQAIAHLIHTPAGEPMISLHERHWTRRGSQLQRHVFETSIHHHFLMRPADLGVVHLRSLTQERERESREFVELSEDGKTMELITQMVGQEYHKTFPVPQTVIGSNDLFLKRLFEAGELVEGSDHTFYELDTSVPEAHEKTLRVTGRDEDTGNIQVAFDTVTLTLGPDGLLLEGFYGDVRIVREPPELARDWGDTMFAANDTMNLDYLVPALPGIEGVVVDITVVGDPRGDVFQESDYQRVLSTTRGEKATTYELLLQPYQVHPDRTPFPMTLTDEQKAELAAYLEPTALINADSPLIRDAAKEAIGDCEDSFQAVNRLLSKVGRSLASTYTKIAALSAIEALQQGRGDCAEHAVLFNAFARSQGIPTRECSGYVFWGQRGGRHAWSQAWIGGKWVHVDCVGGILEGGPQYIQFYQQSPDGSVDRELARRQHVLSTCDTHVEVVGFVLDGKRYDLDARAKHGRYTSGDRYLHPFTRLVVERPEGWSWGDSGRRDDSWIEMRKGGLTVRVECSQRAAAQLVRGFDWSTRFQARRRGEEIEGDLPAVPALLPATLRDGLAAARAEPQRISTGQGENRGEILALDLASGGSLAISTSGDPAGVEDLEAALEAIVASVRFDR